MKGAQPFLFLHKKAFQIQAKGAQNFPFETNDQKKLAGFQSPSNLLIDIPNTSKLLLFGILCKLSLQKNQ